VIRRVLRFLGLVAPRPEDFDAMSNAAFTAYMERSGFAARIAAAREEDRCRGDGTGPWCIVHQRLWIGYRCDHFRPGPDNPS
jgi:hypothetical protein